MSEYYELGPVVRDIIAEQRELHHLIAEQALTIDVLKLFANHKVSCNCFICRNLLIEQRLRLARTNGHTAEIIEGRVKCLETCSMPPRFCSDYRK